MLQCSWKRFDLSKGQWVAAAAVTGPKVGFKRESSYNKEGITGQKRDQIKDTKPPVWRSWQVQFDIEESNINSALFILLLKPWLCVIFRQRGKVQKYIYMTLWTSAVAASSLNIWKPTLQKAISNPGSYFQLLPWRLRFELPLSAHAWSGMACFCFLGLVSSPLSVDPTHACVGVHEQVNVKCVHLFICERLPVLLILCLVCVYGCLCVCLGVCLCVCVYVPQSHHFVIIWCPLERKTQTFNWDCH